MLTSFNRKFRRKPLAQRWSDGYYINAFRPQLEHITKQLSKERVVQMRFNGTLQCVEMYQDWKTIVAQIRVQGEGRAPTHAIVTSNLPDESKAMFTKAFPFRVDFEPLA